MKSDFKQLLQLRFFVYTFIFSALLRIFFHFIFLPSTPSDFGPDEGTYGVLARYVADKLPVEDFPAYGPGLYNTSRSIILPSALLIRFGISDLDAVRIISTCYGLASLPLLIASLISWSKTFKTGEDLSKFKLSNIQKALILVFAFLPSNFLWSTLGLRESASNFFLILFSYLFLKMISASDVVSRIIYTCLATLSLAFSFGARRETALVFSVVFFLFSLKLWIKLRRFTFTAVVLLGVVLGQIYTTTPKIEMNPEVQGNPTAQLQVPKVVLNPIVSLKNQLLTVKVLEYKRQVNRLDAQSALPKSTCNYNFLFVPSSIFCIFKELPYLLFAFLFRPLIFFDSGSNFLYLAGLENLFWTFLIILTVITTLKTIQFRNSINFVYCLLSYSILFSVAASLYEGNLGTAFRHKSTILWPLILSLLIMSRNVSLGGLIAFRNWKGKR